MDNFRCAAAGADAVMLSRKGPVREFKANLGVVATVADHEKFQQRYASEVKKVCDRHNISWKRPFCRAADLRYFAGDDLKTIQIIESIVKEIASEIKRVHIVYTMIFPSAVPKVHIYTAQPPVESLSPVKFQDTLAHPYPYLCLWAYSRDLTRPSPPLACDHFAGEVTSAWEELEQQCPPRIFFDGANTNATISLADLLIRLLDKRFGLERLTDILNETRLPNFLPELGDRLKPFYLGQKYLKKIVPMQRQKINYVPYVTHPVIFIVKEPTSLQTADFISRASIMDAIYCAAVRLGGSVKFFDPKDSNDQRLIKPGDYFLWVGEHGKRFIESLPGLGYKDLNICDAKEVSKITRTGI